MFEQNYPTETTSESAAISSDDFSSPFEEFERKSPGLRIVTTHTAGSGDIDRGPRSALDTSRAGGEAFERAMLKNLDSLDPEEDDRELYEILNGGEGAQGNPYDQDEQELELDFDPNAPEIEQVIVTKSNPQSSGRPIVLPTAPSTEKSSGTSDRAPTQPTTRSDDLLFSSSVAQQSQSETSTAESSSQYRRLIPRSHPSGSTVTSRMMAVGQEYPARTSAGNPTQVRASSYDGQSVSNIRSTAMGSSLSRPMLFRRQLGPQASQPYWQSQQRPVSAEPSTFQQQQRRHDQRRVSQQSIEEKSFAEGHRQGHYHGQVSVPGFDQGQQYTHGASIAEYQGPGFSLNDDDFAPLHGNQSNSYDPSMWQHTPHAHEETMVLPHRGLINDEDDDTIFQSIHDAKSWKHKHLVPNNRIDNTIPQTPEDQKRVVKRLFNAINDTQRAMPSTYVKYFEEHKYTAQFIESVCWTVLVWSWL